jgi:hypothetical protein
MKAVSFANRLVRDLDVKSFTDLTSDARLEILDAINGALQRMHSVAPAHSKITTGSILLPEPQTITLGVTNGSADITGHDFEESDYYRTIRIDGDDSDNQVMGVNELLHPYQGTTGTVNATLYGDAASILEPYEEMIGDPRVIESGRILTHHKTDRHLFPNKGLAEPCYYWSEPNARNHNPPAPAVIRVDTFPDQNYRLEAQFSLAPARIKFTDLLSPAAEIPIRDEHVEAYLLPLTRSILCESDLWKKPAIISKVAKAGESALARYEALVSQTLVTPRNRVRTKPGY